MIGHNPGLPSKIGKQIEGWVKMQHGQRNLNAQDVERLVIGGMLVKEKMKEKREKDLSREQQSRPDIQDELCGYDVIQQTKKIYNMIDHLFAFSSFNKAFHMTV